MYYWKHPSIGIYKFLLSLTIKCSLKFTDELVPGDLTFVDRVLPLIMTVGHSPLLAFSWVKIIWFDSNRI